LFELQPTGLNVHFIKPDAISFTFGVKGPYIWKTNRKAQPRWGKV